LNGCVVVLAPPAPPVLLMPPAPADVLPVPPAFAPAVLEGAPPCAPPALVPPVELAFEPPVEPATPALNPAAALLPAMPDAAPLLDSVPPALPALPAAAGESDDALLLHAASALTEASATTATKRQHSLLELIQCVLLLTADFSTHAAPQNPQHPNKGQNATLLSKKCPPGVSSEQIIDGHAARRAPAKPSASRTHERREHGGATWRGVARRLHPAG
jgi:hypothetical protein